MLDAIAKLVDLDLRPKTSRLWKNSPWRYKCMSRPKRVDAEIVRTSSDRTSPCVCADGRPDRCLVHWSLRYRLSARNHESSPFRIEGDKAYGAGILDMKAGLVLMTEVARYMAETDKKTQFDPIFQLR